VIVRDSKDPDGPVLIFETHRWQSLIAAVLVDVWPDAYVTWDDDTEHASMTVPGDRTVLRFTAGEMAAFERGAHNGEYTLDREPEPTNA